MVETKHKRHCTIPHKQIEPNPIGIDKSTCYYVIGRRVSKLPFTGRLWLIWPNSKYKVFFFIKSKIQRDCTWFFLMSKILKYDNIIKCKPNFGCLTLYASWHHNLISKYDTFIYF